MIALYKKGMAELVKGLAIDLGNTSGPKWDRARKLREKMKTNLAMVQDRLEYLGMLE